MKKIIIIIAAAAVLVAGVGVFFVYKSTSGTTNINRTSLSTGERYLAELNYEKATAELLNVINAEPANIDAYLSLAKAYGYMGDFESAKNILNEGITATNSTVLKKELENTERSLQNTETSSSGDARTVKIGSGVYPVNTKELVIRNCGLTSADLNDIGKFTELERLDISGNEITDISFLRNVKTLKKLFAAGNKIADVSPLSEIETLEYVGLRDNQIENASALLTGGGIKYLHLADNKITTLSELSDSIKLLYVSGNGISDTSPLKRAPKLLYCDMN